MDKLKFNSTSKESASAHDSYNYGPTGSYKSRYDRSPHRHFSYYSEESSRGHDRHSYRPTGSEFYKSKCDKNTHRYSSSEHDEDSAIGHYKYRRSNSESHKSKDSKINSKSSSVYNEKLFHSQLKWLRDSESFKSDHNLNNLYGERNCNKRLYSDRSPSNDEQYDSIALIEKLDNQFGAVQCYLCSIDFPSPIIAKLHYSGKRHTKNLKRFLLEQSQSFGITSTEVEEYTDLKPERSNAVIDYCEVCDKILISESGQLAHYSSNTHRSNKQHPSHTRQKKKAYEVTDKTGYRFGISTDVDSAEVVECKSINMVNYEEFVCNLCDVRVVSLHELQSHLLGKKHEKTVKKKTYSKDRSIKRYSCRLCDVGFDFNDLYLMHLRGKNHKKALLKVEINESSKDVYCKECKLTFNSFEVYQAHLQGKTHLSNFEEKNKEIVKSENKTCEGTCTNVSLLSLGSLDEHKCEKSLDHIDCKPKDLMTNWCCSVCHNTVFSSEQEYLDHQKSKRHIICMFNKGEGDIMCKELEHWYCYLCKKQCDSFSQYTTHLFEEQHMTLYNAQADFELNPDIYKCTVCQLLMDDDTKEEHMRDPRHLRKALKNDTITAISEMANDANIVATKYHCANCNVYLTSFVKYSSHVHSEEHINRVLAVKMQQTQIK